MKVIVITQGISRIVFPLLNSGHEIVGIIESAPRPKKSWVYKVYRKSKKYIGKLARLCKARNLPYYFLDGKVKLDLLEWVQNKSPDIIVVFSMSQLLPSELFNLPRFGTINLHPSYLPDYRGPLPDYWQYYNMEMSPGVTIHYVDSGEDTGPIIEQERIPIELGITSPEWLDIVVGTIGVKLLLKVLDDIQKGKVKSFPQPTVSKTIRARSIKVSEHDMQINWEEWQIEKIWHVLRGTQLWLNAIEQPSGLLKGQRWIIGSFHKKTNTDYKVKSIVKINGRYHLICKDGYIELAIKFSVFMFIKGIFIK